MTKHFEEIVTLPAQDVPAWLQASPQRSKGEFVWVIHAQAAVAAPDDQHDALLRLLMQELPVKSAVKLATEITHAPRNWLYERALALREEAND